MKSYTDLNQLIFSHLDSRDEDSLIIQKESTFITKSLLNKMIDDINYNFQSFNFKQKIVSLVINDPIEYMAFDLFLLSVGAINMTVPMEFSDEQIANFLENADFCIVDNDSSHKRLTILSNNTRFLSPSGESLSLAKASHDNKWDSSWARIVHTSGTTSNPKGAIISKNSLLNMVNKLSGAITTGGELNYFSFQPLSLLIEQIFALYLPIVNNGKVIFKSDSVSAFGLYSCDSKKYLDEISKAKANFFFFPPKITEDISKSSSQLENQGINARQYYFQNEDIFILTGGGVVNQHAIKQLDQMGIDVFEGYGTSENSSVISLNTRKDHQPGTVGKPLPGTDAYIKDGEIVISSNSLFSGYLTNKKIINPTSGGEYFTGDAGYINDEGYIVVNGRKKNTIILSSARNICPEHIESVYRRSQLIDKIVVFGDSKPYLTALVVSSRKGISYEEMNDDMESSSKHIPSFSKIKKFILIEDKQAFTDEFFTVTGRPRREKIKNHLSKEINSLY